MYGGHRLNEFSVDSRYLSLYRLHILSTRAEVYTLYIRETPHYVFSMNTKIEIIVTNRRIYRPLRILPFKMVT